jgi:prepilin-type N-terminal cleavage/methylation domain-containing protein
MSRPMTRFRRPLRAFTLVEILIVVVILGILAAVVVPMYQARVRSARAAAFVATVRTFQKAYDIAVSQGMDPNITATLDDPAEMKPYLQKQVVGTMNAFGAAFMLDAGRLYFAGGAPMPTDKSDLALDVDELLDDGDLVSGMLTASNTIYGFILAGHY